MPFIVIVVGIVAFFILFTWLIPVQLWIAALAAGVKVGIFNLIAMRLRRVPPPVIVNSMIMAHKAGLEMSSDRIEAHYLAGGNVVQVVKALIAADKANIGLTFERACAIDLAGRDILQAVQMSVMPKVIDAPDPTKGKQAVDAVAMDGIQLKAKARVTVRANLDRLVGGAVEETIIARVGEGIVTTIGSAETHKKVLENPDSISKKVLEKGLDSGTAFEILSIDIADVDVGENIGARLQTKQAEADLQIAKAKAEERRAMAVAQEQEMKARVQEMRAKVVEAEAEVPKAMADAFRKGNMGIMDYYRMKNIQSDTGMRDSIAGLGPKEEKKE
ncbi:flotillin-like protein FloA [bacterium]|nr:flotillin-like protein FloA [bacterium]